MFSFLFRIVLFLIAISLIKGVLGFVQRLWFGFQSGRFSVPSASPAPARGQTGETVLQQDPVCGIYVSVETSLKKVSAGKVFHFCSAECRDRFRS
jgi:YHS domain-containing protein